MKLSSIIISSNAAFEMFSHSRGVISLLDAIFFVYFINCKISDAADAAGEAPGRKDILHLLIKENIYLSKDMSHN